MQTKRKPSDVCKRQRAAPRPHALSFVRTGGRRGLERSYEGASADRQTGSQRRGHPGREQEREGVSQRVLRGSAHYTRHTGHTDHWGVRKDAGARTNEDGPSPITGQLILPSGLSREMGTKGLGRVSCVEPSRNGLGDGTLSCRVQACETHAPNP